MGQNLDEYMLKSAYLYKMCKYAQWPASINQADTFRIVVIGDHTEKDKIIIPNSLLLNNKPIEITNIEDYQLINNCQALFICQSASNNIKEILDYISEKDILTFADTPGFSDQGVMVNLYIEDDKVGFELNLIAINNSTIKLHSLLYTIGKVKTTTE